MTDHPPPQRPPGVWTVRRANSADIGEIVAIEQAPAFAAFIGRSDAAWHRRQFARLDVAYLVAGDDTAFGGFLVLADLADAHGNVLLQSMAVGAPGQGIGGRLVVAALSLLRSRQNAHRLWLTVAADNERALRFFGKHGFSVEGLLRQSFLRADGSRVSQVLMSLLREEWTLRV